MTANDVEEKLMTYLTEEHWIEVPARADVRSDPNLAADSETSDFGAGS
jgi:hypothetical protein